jgi:hypothetical protein
MLIKGLPPSCAFTALIPLKTHDGTPYGQEILFLFMPVLAQTFFPFVRCHFMSFSFFSAWHIRILL